MCDTEDFSSVPREPGYEGADPSERVQLLVLISSNFGLTCPSSIAVEALLDACSLPEAEDGLSFDHGIRPSAEDSPCNSGWSSAAVRILGPVRLLSE